MYFDYAKKSLKSHRVSMMIFSDISQIIGDNFNGQLEEFWYDETKDIVHIRTCWEKYARGCSLGQQSEEWNVPIKDFFGDLHGWLFNEREKIKKVEEEKRNREKARLELNKVANDLKFLAELKAKYE